MEYKRRVNKSLIFDDYPKFQPNLTPKQIFELGGFGGTYFREIHSTITKCIHTIVQTVFLIQFP